MKQLWIFLENIYDDLLDRYFDWSYGINTVGKVDVYNLMANSINVVNARAYQATRYRLLAQIFAKLPINCLEYNFIDYGAGKGRGVLFAALSGFKRSIGIEFAKNLVEKFHENMNYLHKKQKIEKDRIDIFFQDVLDFSSPNGPNIHFFFNPFDNFILQSVIKKIKASQNFSNDDIFIYVNPIREHVLLSEGLVPFDQIFKVNPNRIVKFYRKEQQT